MEYVNLTPLISCIRNVMIKLPVTYEVIVVDDYSGDGSDHLCSELSKTNPLIFVARKNKKRSLSLAVLEGLRVSTGQLIVVMDADLSHPPDRLPLLLNILLRNEADFVIGSRALGNREGGSMTFPQVFGNWLATSMMKWFYKVNYTDLGPFRAIAFPQLVALDMKDKTYGWTVEMQLKAAKQKLRITEVPVNYKKRIGVSKVSGTVKGTVMAGYKIIFTIFKYL